MFFEKINIQMSVSLICAGQTLNFVKICICEFTSVYDSCTRNQAPGVLSHSGILHFAHMGLSHKSQSHD